MPSTRNYIAFGLLLLALEACGMTQRFVDQPRLTIDESELDAHRAAVGAIFVLGALMCVGIGNYAPSMALLAMGLIGLTAHIVFGATPRPAGVVPSVMIGLSISGVASGFAALPVALLAWGTVAAINAF